MSFLQTWLAGYYHPAKFADGLKGKPAPQWGLYAVLLRALLLSLGMYLPLYLSGHVPPTPSWLPFIPTEGYYGALIWIVPLVLLSQWLIGSAIVHVVLRLGKQGSDFDRILNLSGMTALVVGTFLIAWDWVWIGLGGMNQYLLGISHLVIDGWCVVLMVVGLKRILGTPVWLGIPTVIVSLAAGMPSAIMFMRSPL